VPPVRREPDRTGLERDDEVRHDLVAERTHVGIVVRSRGSVAARAGIGRERMNGVAIGQATTEGRLRPAALMSRRPVPPPAAAHLIAGITSA